MSTQDTEEQSKDLMLPKGTIVKVKGVPFELNSDTLVTGNRSNHSLVFDSEQKIIDQKKGR